MSEQSEFGKGLCYCLGLFLAHADRFKEKDEFGGCADMWFNGASDHVYELQVDSVPNDELKNRLDVFKDKVLRWGHGFSEPIATKKDVYWSLQEAKDLLRLIDKLHGVPTEKGQWE